MKIGDEVYVHGYVDEIRNDVVIIRNEGGYFGTVPSEVNCSEKPNNREAKNYCDDCLYADVCDNKEFFYACTSKATRSKMEQVDKDTNVRSKDCEACKHWEHGAHSHYYCARLEMRQECHYEPKTEPQTCANGCKWLNQDGECTEPNGECHIEYRTQVDEPQTERSSE